MGIREWFQSRFRTPAGSDKFEPVYPASQSIRTTAGMIVTEDQALTLPTFYGAVKVLSEDVASVPLHLYRKAGSGKTRATDMTLYRLLHDAPNPWMTSMELREALMYALLVWGNAYVYKEYDRGVLVALWPLRSDRMAVLTENGTLSYAYFPLDGGEPIPYTSSQVCHIRSGTKGDGVIGMSLLRMLADSVGQSLATENMVSRFYSNGAQYSVYVNIPADLEMSEAAFQRLKASFTDDENAHRKWKARFLQDGITVQPAGVPPAEAQMLESRMFSIAQFCRAFRIPPDKLQDLTNAAAYKSLDAQAINYVVYSLRPWCVRIEQALNMRLLPEALRGALFFEHQLDALLRGDPATRFAAYKMGRDGGWLSTNDIRAAENMNPVAWGDDDYIRPLNTTLAKDDAEDAAEDDTGDNGDMPMREPAAAGDEAAD